MKKNTGPTPQLVNNHVRDKIFTYSENALLDQITLEITQAWQKHLLVITRAHKKCEQTIEESERIYSYLENYLPKLDHFLNSECFIEKWEHYNNTLDVIKDRLLEQGKSLFEIDKKINFEYVTSLLKSIEKLEKNVKNLEEQILLMNRRRWWHRFFKPQT